MSITDSIITLRKLNIAFRGNENLSEEEDSFTDFAY